MNRLVFALVGWMAVLPVLTSASIADSPPAYLATWGSLGSGPGQFSQPLGIAVDNGYVYVADQLNQRVQKLTTGGVFVAQWPTGPIDFPSGLTVGPNGVVYVSMNHTHIVNMYSTTGAFLGQIGSPGSAPGQFTYPVGLATDAAGNLYVADSGNNRVEKFTAGGAFLYALGGMNNPYFVATNSAGDVFVADRNNSKVEAYTSSGGFLYAWGSAGSGDGQFAGLSGLHFDSVGNIYVVDSGTNNRVEKFTSTGTFLTKWGSFGAGIGQFEYPADVTIDGDGTIYVTDWFNNRIELFGPGATPVKSSSWGRLKAAYH
jgi:tripartite motif-containing protein 71